MQDIESIIQEICQKANKDRFEVRKLIEDKQVKFRHQISEMAAAKILAKELNVELTQIKKKTLEINDLHHTPPGTQDISLKGIVSRIYAPIEFQKSQGTGRLLQIVVSDKSGTIKLSLWDNMVNFAQNLNIERGNIIQVFKGVLRMGKTGEREVHLNDLSSIQIVTEPNIKDQYPDIEENIFAPTNIGQDLNNKEIDIKGIINFIGEERSFTRPSQNEGRLISFSLSDSEKSIRGVAWNDKVSDINNFELGDEILIEGATIKLNKNQIPEIHINRRSNINLLSKKNKISQKPVNDWDGVKESQGTPTIEKTIPDEIGTIKELENKQFTRIVVRIGYKDELRSFTRKDGSKGYFIRIGVFDNTGSNILVLWDDQAVEADKWKENSLLDISDVYLKENPRGGKEIFLTRSAVLKITKENVNQIPSTLSSKPIKEITPNWKIVNVIGKVIDVGETREFTRQKDESIGQVRWLRIADKTGTLRVVAWNDQVLLYDSIQVDDLIQIYNAVTRLQEAGIELHLNFRSSIETLDPENTNLPEWINLQSTYIPDYPITKNDYNNFERINLLSLDSQPSNIEIRARIKYFGDREPVYFACPKCSQKISENYNEVGECSNHGQQNPIPKFRIPVELDDGYGTIITSIFSPTAELITGIQEKQLLNEESYTTLTDSIKRTLTGKEFIFQGILKEKIIGNPPKRTMNFNIRNVYAPNTIYEINLLYENNGEEKVIS
ncbi:MAG: OB-fold nucleic acid binding domain-containing protein [Candidatus Thorarchaeota archaeon]